MVGCDDADDFDLFVVEDFAVVFERFGFAFSDLFVVSGAFAMVCVDVADRDDIAVTVMVVGVTGAHSSQADAADFHAILGAGSKGIFGPGPVGYRRDGGSGLSGAFQEVAAGGLAHRLHSLRREGIRCGKTGFYHSSGRFARLKKGQ